MSRGSTLVLHVEDEELDQLLLARTLKGIGQMHHLDSVNDGEEALTYLRGMTASSKPARPVVVLLDLNLPRMDGLRFLRELREDPSLKRTVVFVITTSSRREDLEAAYALGVSGYVVKSEAGAGFGDLVELIDRFLATVSLPPPPMTAGPS